MRKIFLLFVILPFIGWTQHDISLSITGVKNSDGQISVAVYDKSEGFLKFDSVFKSGSASAEKGTTQVTIKDLPNGKYALAIFHDENDNGKLDTNWLGIPKEKVGFSKAKMKAFGPPDFEECSFELDSDKKLIIGL